MNTARKQSLVKKKNLGRYLTFIILSCYTFPKFDLDHQHHSHESFLFMHPYLSEFWILASIPTDRILGKSRNYRMFKNIQTKLEYFNVLTITHFHSSFHDWKLTAASFISPMTLTTLIFYTHKFAPLPRMSFSMVETIL